MLTADQMRQFQVFGYVMFRGAYGPERIQQITQESEQQWERRLGWRPDGSKKVHMSFFVEQSQLLTGLIEDEDLFTTISQLLGEDFIWGGSEGNVGIQTGKEAQHWHADRLGEEDSNYPRIKIMIYLDPMREENGALRVIPGSHRMPMHEDLLPFTNHAPPATFFGLRGQEVPAQVLTTDPGDMVMFHHSLFHAVYGNQGVRRFIAIKFAARPTCDQHLRSIWKWSEEVFEPDDAFLRHDNERIRRMVEGLPEWGRSRASWEK